MQYILLMILSLMPLTLKLSNDIQQAIFFGQNSNSNSNISDNFNGTALSSQWCIVEGGFNVASNVVSPSGGLQSSAYYCGASFTPNQQSCLTVVAPYTGSYIGPGVRLTSSGAGYIAQWGGGTGGTGEGQVGIQKLIPSGGTSGISASAVTVFVGHSYCLRAVTSADSSTVTLTLSDNGTDVLSGVDTTSPNLSGNPGMAGFFSGTDSSASTFIAGDI